MINLKIIKDAGFAGKAAPPDAGPAGPSRGKGKGGGIGGGKKGGLSATLLELKGALQAAWFVNTTSATTTVDDAQTGGYDLTANGAGSLRTGHVSTNAQGWPGTGVDIYRTPITGEPFAGTGSFMWAGWVYPDNFNGTNTPQTIVGRAVTGNPPALGDRDWRLHRWPNNNEWNFNVFSGTTQYSAISTVAPVLDTWTFIAGGYSSGDNQVYIAVDGETIVNTAVTGTINNNGTHLFFNCFGTTNWDGRSYYDQVGFYAIEPTQARADALHNGGVGIDLSTLL